MTAHKKERPARKSWTPAIIKATQKRDVFFKCIELLEACDAEQRDTILRALCTFWGVRTD